MQDDIAGREWREMPPPGLREEPQREEALTWGHAANGRQRLDEPSDSQAQEGDRILRGREGGFWGDWRWGGPNLLPGPCESAWVPSACCLPPCKPFPPAAAECCGAQIIGTCDTVGTWLDGCQSRPPPRCWLEPLALMAGMGPLLSHTALSLAGEASRGGVREVGRRRAARPLRPPRAPGSASPCSSAMLGQEWACAQPAGPRVSTFPSDPKGGHL